MAILLSCGILFESFLAILQFYHQHSLGGIFYFFGERSFTAATPGIAQAIINGQLILRPYGTFSHPNSLAGYFLSSFFLLAHLCGSCHCERNKIKRSNLFMSRDCFVIRIKSGLLAMTTYRPFFYIIYSLFFIILFISFSRSTWLVAGLAFFLIGVLNIKKLFNLLNNFKFLFVILIFALCIFNLLFKPIYSRIESIATTDTQSLQKRADLNRLAIKMFLSSPLVGVGLNNFIPNIPKFTPLDPQIRLYQPAHNIYLLILAESGLLGFSLFLYIIYKTLKLSLLFQPSWTKQSQSLYIFLSFICILLLGLFDHYWITLQQNQLLLTLIIGFIFTKKLKRQIPQ